MKNKNRIWIWLTLIILVILALIIAEEAKSEFNKATENILNVYRHGLQEIQDIWQRNVYQARQRGSMLTDWEIRDTQQMVNCNQQTILNETCQYYEKKISKVTRIETDFSLLISEIKTMVPCATRASTMKEKYDVLCH